MKRQGLLSLTGILLLVLLALLTLHEWERVVPGTGNPVPDQAPPMLQLSGVSARSFSEQGEPGFRLRARTMTWLEAEGRSLVEDPELMLPLSAQGQWQITARRGELEDHTGRISLEGEVFAYRTGSMPMELETSELVYLNRSGQVSVPAPVVIRSSTGSIRAGALEANLSSQVLQLMGGVETRYEPATR